MVSGFIIVFAPAFIASIEFRPASRPVIGILLTAWSQQANDFILSLLDVGKGREQER